MQPKPEMTVDLVFDPVCPWCFVGFRGLDWALMALSFEYQIEVRYRPYRLDPDVPADGRDRLSTIVEKFPDPKIREQLKLAVIEAMADVGVDFDSAKPQRLPNTIDAHRLVRWAQLEGLGKPVVAGVFEAYWIHGEDIGQYNVLAQVAEEAGLDGNEIRARLATSEDVADVTEEAQAFRDGGVANVPTFIVNEATGFAGALPKAELLGAFRQLLAEADDA